MGVISKDSINKWIVTQLSSGKRGEKLTVVEACEIVAAIVHKLKTGCKWRELPTKEFSTATVLVGKRCIITLEDG